MLPAALFHLMAVVCSASWTQALPLYPHLEPRAEFFQSLASEAEEGRNGGAADQRDENDLYPLMHRDGATDFWTQGEKDSAQQKKFNNVVDELKDVVVKLAAADALRSQGFIRSEQNLPKANKREKC